MPQTARFTTIDPIRDGSNWFAYCNNEPVNFQDLWGLECVSDNGFDYSRGGNPHAQEVMEAALDTLKKTASGTESPLNQHVNTGALAGAMSNNLGYLDSQTQAYYSGMPESVRKSAIKEQLDNQTVITGVSRDEASRASLAMGMVLDPSGGDAFSVGTTIFVFDTGTPDSETVGHEGVHGVQANAAGSTIEFLERYNDASRAAGSNPYYGNEYEKAAYSFGPYNSQAETNLSDGYSYVQY